MLRPGERLGDYEIVHPLRSGGMATLYRARRRGAAGFAREVAIKVVHPHLAANAAFLRMFVEEAHLAVRIHHPNVVHVEELGAEGGNLYLVMELIRGCSLAEMMEALVTRGRRLPVLQAVRLAIQVAEGLHAAHETRDDGGALLNVVHRDVSPQNVIVSEKGYAKVIDFGIAKALGRDRTRTGTIKGTYAYMAPEQARGQEVDRRSDVYAMAVVLWELLTLRRLFDAPTDVELLDRVREPVVEPPSRHARDVTPELDAAVLAALSPRREDRPATADAFRRMLCEALPAASTEGAAALEQLVRELMPVHRPSFARAADARDAVAGKGFRRGPDATTLPTEGREPAPTPDAGVALRATPEPPRPRRAKKRALAALLGAAALAAAVLALRSAPPAGPALPAPKPVAPADEPAAAPPAAEEPRVAPPRAIEGALPSMSLAPLDADPQPAQEPPPRAVRAREDRRATKRETAREPAPRKLTTRLIDGVLVLDEAPY